MNPSLAEELLLAWLDRRLPSSEMDWLREKIDAGKAGAFRSVALGFSMASRRLGKEELALTPVEMSEAQESRPGWRPDFWTVDQSARVLLSLSLWNGDSGTFVHGLDRLFAASDVGELVALYQGLCLFPDPPAHRLRAAEGIRTNMRAVFEAVAHHNPYPAEQLNEGCWNQMVLKSLFVGSRLDRIVGLDGRANRSLARMLWDYARERRAAGRTINPELWRCVAPFVSESYLAEAQDEMARRLQSDRPAERAGIALAMQSLPQMNENQKSVANAQAAGWDWTRVANEWAKEI